MLWTYSVRKFLRSQGSYFRALFILFFIYRNATAEAHVSYPSEKKKKKTLNREFECQETKLAYPATRGKPRLQRRGKGKTTVDRK